MAPDDRCLRILNCGVLADISHPSGERYDMHDTAFQGPMLWTMSYDDC